MGPEAGRAQHLPGVQAPPPPQHGKLKALTGTQNCWLPHNRTTDQAAEKPSHSGLLGKIREEWPRENVLGGASSPGTGGAHPSEP